LQQVNEPAVHRTSVLAKADWKEATGILLEAGLIFPFAKSKKEAKTKAKSTSKRQEQNGSSSSSDACDGAAAKENDVPINPFLCLANAGMRSPNILAFRKVKVDDNNKDTVVAQLERLQWKGTPAAVCAVPVLACLTF
jgi:hypothetical protein